MVAVNGQTFKVWPLPEQYSTGSNIGIIANWKGFSFALQQSPMSQGDFDILSDAFGRYESMIFFDDSVSSSSTCPKFNTNKAVVCFDRAIVTLKTSSKDHAPEPYFGMDESYSISITNDGQIQLIANTVWGALRAIESFSQLIHRVDSLDNVNFGANYYTFVEYLPIQVKDNPRFPWRGFLIDTARHYYSVKKILQIVDSLSYMKMNVFHWHLMDAQSFPFVVSQFPDLSGKGAYRKKAVYSVDDVLTVVEYARRRGIRVVPEVDMPGHAASWGFGYPNVTANCPSFAANINNIPLNVATDYTYTVVAGVIKQLVMSGFSDQYYHFGGDELVMSCWLEDPTIQSFMKQKGFTNPVQLLYYFEDRLRDIYMPLNKTMICWEELALEYGYNVPKDTIVHVWKQRNTLIDIVQKGYKTLLSGGWYLDQQVPNRNKTFYEWVDTWINFYQNDPTEGFGMTDAQKKLVMGGEACMWSEQVDDSNFNSRVFPRSLAIAERLWSPSSVTDITSARIRMENARCNVLVRRGISAGPVMPGYCEATYDNYE